MTLKALYQSSSMKWKSFSNIKCFVLLTNKALFSKLVNRGADNRSVVDTVYFCYSRLFESVHAPQGNQSISCIQWALGMQVSIFVCSQVLWKWQLTMKVGNGGLLQMDVFLSQQASFQWLLTVSLSKEPLSHVLALSDFFMSVQWTEEKKNNTQRYLHLYTTLGRVTNNIKAKFQYSVRWVFSWRNIIVNY